MRIQFRFHAHEIPARCAALFNPTNEMMTLQLLKQHVRADDFADDDDYLTHLLAAATEHVTQATNRTSEELKALGGGDYPMSLQQAILLLAGHWYNQREAVGTAQMAEVPYTLQALIKPYRRLAGEEQEEGGEP